VINKKLLVLATVFFVAAVATLVIVRHQHVLDSEDLAKAISKQLPVGTPKAVVVNFIQKRHPMFSDDLGSRVETRLSGLAENMIYRKDMVLIFDFDSDGKLISHSKKVYLTFF
jgi:hypothetical protein